MNRRDFFKVVPDAVASAAANSQPPAAHAPLISPPYRAVAAAGSPRQYHAGECVFVEDVRAWLCRDSLGFYAIDAHCTHLGCIVRLDATGFACSCHHSHYSRAGAGEAGPAPRDLRYLYVDLDADGNLIIYRDHAAAPGDRFIA
jgi:Rieske Fe-S protein